MNATETINEIYQSGCAPELHEGRLVLTGDTEGLSSEVVAAIHANHSEISAYARGKLEDDGFDGPFGSYYRRALAAHAKGYDSFYYNNKRVRMEVETKGVCLIPLDPIRTYGIFHDEEGYAQAIRECPAEEWEEVILPLLDDAAIKGYLPNDGSLERLCGMLKEEKEVSLCVV